jgi:large repetitive protein
MPSHIYKLGGTVAATLTIPPTLFLTLTGITGTFYKDDLVTDTAAGHGYVVKYTAATSKLVIVQTSGSFTTDTITDSTSGATATISVIAAHLSDIAISSSTPASVLTAAFDTVLYKLGDTVNVTLTFDRPITITNTPRVGININGVTKYANYVSGTTTAAIVFRYTPVVVGDTGVPGTVALISPIDLNTTGTLKDATTVDATLTYTVPSTPLVAIDGAVPTAPVLTGITDGHHYVTSDVVTVVATYNEAVNVTGSPRIPLVLTSGNKYITYASGTGTTALTFTYPVVGGDISIAGTVSLTSPIGLNSGTIKDLAGNNATLTFTPPATSTVAFN